MRYPVTRERPVRFYSGLVCILTAALTGVAWLADKPPLLENYSFSQELTDRNGELLRLTTAKDQSFRAFAPLEQISPKAIEATLLYEDRFFRSHPGVNPVALFEAALDTYLLGGKRRGASTITMQLARLHFGIESSTPLGKVEQICAALRLEAHYTKDEILEAYLNLAPYGGNVVGIKAASLIYFGKEPADLTLGESLLLSVIPQNPNRRKPTREGLESNALLAARTRVAQVYAAAHPEVEESALGLSHPFDMRRSASIPFEAPHATTALLGRKSDVKKIETTIDARLQRRIETRVASYVERNRDVGIANAAVMLVDHRTMEVLALVGSADFHDEEIDGQVSAATAKRSPGSTLKPFVYALAMDQGIVHPRSLLRDAPTHFADYTPHNFDGEFIGPLTATEALVRSRNIPAVWLTSQLDDGGLHGLLEAAGVRDLRPREEYGLPVVLGGVELTMEELTSLYAALPAGGVVRKPVYKRGARAESSARILSDEASFLTLKMLEQNPRPGQHFKKEWTLDPTPVAWKTGTSPGSRDAWSIGVVGQQVLAVWVGQFRGGSSPAYVGRKSAAPLFFEIADSLRSRAQHGAAPRDDLNVTRVPVCAVSGMLPGSHCPHEIDSWFIPGKSPISQCEIHQKIAVDNRTGERLCAGSSPHSREEVFELWPSDLAKLFRAAGLPRKMPPPYKKECRGRLKPLLTSTLEITSPREHVVYSLRADRIDSEKIALSANCDADAAKLYWFVDAKLVGRADAGETLLWTPQPGDFEIRVVDDRGRFAKQNVAVKVVE